MKYRKLGTEGPELSRIGFGCWAMGGPGGLLSWGQQDERAIVTAVDVALDCGIKWFDTAGSYGGGHSEEVLGRVLGPRRQDVSIATKFGIVPDGDVGWRFDSSYDSVVRECDASLRRLGTDYIDLYQQHIPDGTGTPLEETVRALEDLARSGKVRYVGLSNVDVAYISHISALRRIDSVQPIYNVLMPEAGRELLPYCQEHGIGVVAYSPLASGLLSGRYAPGHTFLDDTFRSFYSEFVGERLETHLAKVQRLRPIAERLGCTLAQLAVGWVLANPALTSAIVGIRKPGHVVDILPALDLSLDANTLAEIEAIQAQSTAMSVTGP